MISDASIQQIKKAANIKEVVEASGVSLKKAGSDYVGLCPFHNERNPSFHVNTTKNVCKCFTCEKGGNPVNYIMEKEGLDFLQAIRRIADIQGIQIQETTPEQSEREAEERRHRESMFTALDLIQSYFAQRLWAQEPEAEKAAAYASGRWDKEFCKSAGIGYAPWGKEFLEKANSMGISRKTLLDLGIIKEYEPDHQGEQPRVSFMFGGRVTIPIRSISGKVIGFTARTLSAGKKVPKYINSRDSEIYHKGSSLFGIDKAVKGVAREEFIYIVEGAPDVLRLQSVGADNAIASLGTAWTQSQFEKLKKLSRDGSKPKICFIPDNDPQQDKSTLPPGTAAVLKNGKEAVKYGFTVTVKELPSCIENDTEIKSDPDSFLKEHQLSELKEVDFVIFMADKELSLAQTQSAKVAVIKDISLILADMDRTTAVAMLEDLTAKYKNKAAWKSAFAEAVKEKSTQSITEIQKRATANNDDNLEAKYGFFIANSRYVMRKEDNGSADTIELSNFIMRPMFEVQDGAQMHRVFTLQNAKGENAAVQFSPKELMNLAEFRIKISSYGNYVWKAKIDQLMPVLEYVFDNTKRAKAITRLGWNKEGFFAFGDGAFSNSFQRPDDLGLLEIQSKGAFFFPAFSLMNRNDETSYTYERSFIYQNKADITLPDLCNLFAEVFGNNGRLGIAYVISALFRDILFARGFGFPIFDIFGRPQSGKTQLGRAMASFFIPNGQPINITGDSRPAIIAALAQSVNCIVHVDEYKNSIPQPKWEALKATWDGVSRGVMGEDRRIKKTPVHNAMVLSGQELPTIDIALFTRCISVSVTQTSYTPEQTARMGNLFDYLNQGVNHLTMQIVAQRQRFENDFPHYFELTSADVFTRLQSKHEEVSSRIMHNWVLCLAAYRTVQELLSLPFSYKEMLEICMNGMIEQQSVTSKSDEVASFWDYVKVLFQENRISETCDFKLLRACTSIKLYNAADNTVFVHPKDILILRDRRILQHYEADKSRSNKQITLSARDMRDYLIRSTACLGKVKRKFVRMSSPGVQMRDGNRILLDLDMALAFDYSILQDKYGLYISSDNAVIDINEIDDTDTGIDNNEAQNVLNQSTQHPTQQDLPF